MNSALRSDVRPRELWAWAMYDFANSGYTTWLTGGDHRRALLLTGSYFVVGLLLLPGGRVARGRRVALRVDRLDRLPISNPARGNAS